MLAAKEEEIGKLNKMIGEMKEQSAHKIDML